MKDFVFLAQFCSRFKYSSRPSFFPLPIVLLCLDSFLPCLLLCVRELIHRHTYICVYFYFYFLLLMLPLLLFPVFLPFLHSTLHFVHVNWGCTVYKRLQQENFVSIRFESQSSTVHFLLLLLLLSPSLCVCVPVCSPNQQQRNSSLLSLLTTAPNQLSARKELHKHMHLYPFIACKYVQFGSAIAIFSTCNRIE